MSDTLTGNRDFLHLFSAQVTSLVGSGVTSVALAAFAYQLGGRNATAVVGPFGPPPRATSLGSCA